MTPTKYRLVPCEPTEAMIDAGRSPTEFTAYAVACNQANGGSADGVSPVVIAYRAMLDAAPKASEDEALVERVARTIMENRENGGCKVTDWKAEYEDNPHVAQAVDQARAVLKMLEVSHD